MLGEYEINKHSYEGLCYTKLPFSPFLEICWDVYFTLLNGFFHSVPQFLFFKIFLFLWVLLIAFDTFSRENVLSWIYMYIWYVSQIGLMTGKYSEIATYNWKKMYVQKYRLLQYPAEMSISVGSVTFQGCTVRNQFCSRRLLEIKSKHQVQNQCDMIILICTSADNFWSPRNYINLKNGFDET